MPRYIVKLSDAETDYYLEWSTIVDAPITRGMTYVDFVGYYLAVHGETAKASLAERMERVNQKGVSAFDYASVDELISFNRAGENESCLSREELIARYCR